MTIKRSKDEFISGIKKHGYAFSEFSLVTDGNHTVSDADWNYKDIPHLHYIHELAEAVPCFIDHDTIASVFVQKIFGIKFPLSVFIYEPAPNIQLYYTTLFFYILFIESKYERLGPNRTRVITTYSIGFPKFLKWTFPFLRWTIKRNYKNLMSGDIPMRERRGELRSWGYTLHKEDATHSYEKSLDIKKLNAVPPMKAPHPITHEIMLQEIFSDNEEFLFGRSDSWGLRMVKTHNELMIFPRMCHHEGASLDQQKCVDAKIKCPWHGRLHTKIASFDLENLDKQEIVTQYHKLSLEGTKLSIKLIDCKAQIEIIDTCPA